MPRQKQERRNPIICPYCNKEMVCMKQVEPISNLTKGSYIWYVCPRRTQSREDGCGYTSLVQVSPKTKQPSRPVFSIKFKQLKPKKKKKI